MNWKPLDRTHVKNPGHAPQVGDVLRIPSRRPLILRVLEVSEIEPGHWTVLGKILEGSGAGETDEWNFFPNEFEYVRDGAL